MIFTETPELLSPAGSKEALYAAVSAGADAVYFGGTLFNARMNAANFDRDVLKEAVDYCHINGVKAYVTLNTQIYDREVKSALEYASFLYDIGTDALIIADCGLSSLIHSSIPDFSLHASTQMTIHNTTGADLLYSNGFGRVVLAREMSRENIASVCRNSKPEIEVFVHGAICVSCSGQCMMSAMLGGRSGNRGECAQPCRMSYNGGNPISLKDMCLAGHIDELIGCGVASLKIEGRMKSPAYVGGVTEIYRRLLDEKRNATKEEVIRLEKLFSRGGFTDGYFTGNVNDKMLGVRSDEDKQNSRSAGSDYNGKIKRNINPIVNDRHHTDVSVPPIEKKELSKPFFTARFHSASQIPDSHPFRHVYLPLNAYDTHADGIIIPPIIYDSEIEKIEKQLEYASSKGARHALIGNLSHIRLVEKYSLIPHADFRLNVFNSRTANALEALLNIESIILSPELILPQIRDITTKTALKGAIVYGRYPLMLLEKTVGADKLRDTKGATFPIIRELGKNVLLNSVPVYMADQLDRLDKAGIEERHMMFTTESRGEVMRVIYAYQHGTIPKEPMRRIK